MPIYACPTCEGIPDSVEARLARAEQAIDLLLRVLHGHGEGHLDAEPSFGDEVIAEWNQTMTERFGHLPGFKPLEGS